MKRVWLAIVSALLILTLALGAIGCSNENPEETGSGDDVKEVAGIYSVDISGAGMPLTFYLKIEENGNFKFSSAVDFATDKNSGTVRKSDSGYLMVYSTVNGAAASGKTTSFTKESDGKLKFTSAILYGGTTLQSPWENEDEGTTGNHYAVPYTEGGETGDEYVVEAGLYTAVYEKSMGPGGTKVPVTYYLNLRDDGKFTAFASFSMMGNQYSFDYGTYSIMGSMCRMTSAVYQDFEDDSKDLTESLIATSETEFEADVLLFNMMATDTDKFVMTKVSEALTEPLISFTGTHEISMGMSVTFDLALDIYADGSYHFASTSSMGNHEEDGFIGIDTISQDVVYIWPEKATEGTSDGCTFDTETGVLTAQFNLGSGSPQEVTLNLVTA